MSFRLIARGAVLTLLSVTTIACTTGGARQVPELMPGVPVGYLLKSDLPASLQLVPPPPTAGSPAQALDEQVHQNAVALRGSPRWEIAIRDADLTSEQAVGAFECALGVAVTREETPRLFQLMQRTMVDAGYSTSAAKEKYQAARPFAVHREPMCTPLEEADLLQDGSYPSGHSALGWGAALVLVEVAPERTNELIARGRSFGESRAVCNVHWLSDIQQGRFIATATVARLHGQKEFMEDINIARREVISARDRALPPTRDCVAETRMLSQPLEGAR